MTKRRATGHGGFREGSGRRSLWPGKGNPSLGEGNGVKLTILLTERAATALQEKAEQLTHRKPPIKTAADVEMISLSDTVEYLIRRAMNIPLED